MKAFRTVAKQKPRLAKTPRKNALIAALAVPDNSAVNLMLANFGFESAPLALSLLNRHPWLETDLKCPHLKADLTNKMTFLDQLGIPSTEVLENCELLQVSTNCIMDRYYFLTDAGIGPDDISAPMIEMMGKGLDYEQRDQLLYFIRAIRPHRTNSEYLATTLDVPLRDVHDAAARDPRLLDDGYLNRDLLVRLKMLGMSTGRVLSRYRMINNCRGWLGERLDLLEDKLEDKGLVAEFLQPTSIFMPESYFQPHLHIFRRTKCKSNRPSAVERDPCYEDRLRNLQRIGQWGFLPTEALEKLVNTKAGISLGMRNPVTVAESSQYLQSVGLTPECIVRHPWLLHFSAARLKDAVELIKDSYGKKKLNERDLPMLINTTINGRTKKRKIVVYDFVYRDLGEGLEVEAQMVKEALTADESTNQLFKDFFRENPFSSVERLKANVKRLRQVGFSVDSLLQSLLVLLIPNEELEVMIEVMVQEEAKYPLKLDLEMETKMLNMMRYQFEYARDF